MRSFSYILFLFILCLSCKPNNGSDLIGPNDILANLSDESLIDIPDPVFEERLAAIDSDKQVNGKIKYGDIKNVDTLNIISVNRGKTIKKLKGIEYFTNLIYLNALFNEVDSLDVSHNTKLEYLNCGGFFGGGGTSPTLKYLNTKNCRNLKYIQCSDHLLSTLDISDNSSLLELNCYNNKIISLDISRNNFLKKLNCSHNRLVKLDINKTITLQELDCSGNLLTELDVSHLTNLISLDCSYNWNSINNATITTLNVSKNLNLEKLNFGGNRIRAIDLNNNVHITDLSCDAAYLTAIDLSNLKELKSLLCSANDLTSLDLTSNPLLESLDASSTEITELNLNTNTKLKRLFIIDNKNLASLDLRPCKDLATCFTFLCPNLKMICVYSLTPTESMNWSKDKDTQYVVCP